MTAHPPFVLALVLALAPACVTRPPPAGEPGAMADGGAPVASASSQGPSPEAGPAASGEAPPRPAPNRRLCRVASLTGHVGDLDGGSPLALGGLYDLAPRTRLAVRDASAGRDLVFVGPARGRPCANDDDEAHLLSGTFEGSATTSGSGEGWLVTPLGVLRHGGVRLRVEVSEEGATVRVESGSAFLWVPAGVIVEGKVLGPPPPAAEGRLHAPTFASPLDLVIPSDAPFTPFRRLEAGTQATLRVQALPSGDDPSRRARRAEVRCVQAAKVTRDLARALAAPDAAVGVLGPLHVERRQDARAACAVASLMAETLPPSETQGVLLRRVAEAQQVWRGIGP